MFTGIVEELGEVAAVQHDGETARITVRAPAVAADAVPGGSVAVNGVCLTVTGVAGRDITADVMAETLRRTALGTLAPGAPVNLERPLRLGDRLGGHLVQGHVDGVATVASRREDSRGHVLRLGTPPSLCRYVVEKGSVAVDGVSLTVSAVSGPGAEPPWFEVSLIPTTLAVTTLGRARPGARVNLEVDMIGKYVERLLDGQRETAARS
jgi:riboflavin synthase